MTVVIGLTGSIATGKSTVSRMFAEWDIPVIDADKLSREVVEPGEAAYEKIVDFFGDEVLLHTGEIDRPALGKIIFGDEEKRKRLNAIVHPEVRKRMIEKREYYKERGENAVVLDIPLLYESGLTDYVNRTMVVFVDEEIQLQRLMDRDGSAREDANERIASQISIKEKARMADAVIDNNGSVEETKIQVRKQLEEWGVLKNPEK
ncbi:dephospho-CoA kinase [Salimicrobium jeotgali]|uniref:Dephospho-CoA kinase n=2 Tax=Salimicrobium TaxID=351195 RepID=K2GCZ1_9BACI|nr:MULTISPECIES: dephospho-CoA kinase [Salimicrobium]AKG04154.1 dephospho-CoA kinase [Salimicrobium jeotgali]EKE32112.1 dephospho-CoA kinase [Salimicrobium jeotgali]MBM7695722.1 dephospho-CoA kinase [Salimicrobium jeotgali]PBB06723.1 dephospho-CoA kinase [Salimicrobium humidisoli]